MATRSLNVVISGDSKPLGIASTKAVGHMDDVESRGKKMGKALALGFAAAGAAAAGALVIGLKKSVDAAVEAEKSQAKLKAQLKASGADYRAHAKEIDGVIQKHSRLAGVDDEDLQDAFSGIVRTTGSVSTAMKDMGLVTDIMRGKNVDAATAGALLSKVHNGNVTALKKMGIAIDPVTKAQDKLKASNKNATKEQIEAAKAADKQATAQKGIAELQKRFGGQAEAYGKTAAGAQDRFRVAMENVQEKLGAKLLPILSTVAGAVAKFLDQIDRGTGVGGKFASVIGGIGSVVGRAVGVVVDFGKRIADTFSGGDKSASGSVSKFAGNARKFLDMVVKAVQDVGRRISAVFSGGGIGGDLANIGRKFLAFQGAVSAVVVYIAKRTIPMLVGVIEGLAKVVRGVVRIISGILSGDFSKAWQGVKDIVRGAFTAVKAIIRGAWDLLGPAMISLAKFLIRKLGEGLKALPGALKDALVGAIELAAKNVPKLIGAALGGLGKAITAGIKAGFGKLNPFGDGLGDGTGMASIAGLGGGGALMGADADLGPFAGLGASYGLHTTSGIRPGSITSSGNVSYHSSGDAIDMAGSPSGMRRFAVALKNRFGGRLRELISPWGELGIKDGKPFRYSGKIQADHSGANAHVHVAYTGPFGDGIGQAVSAARSAGFKGTDLVNAVAIAGAETGYDAEAENLKYPDHSIGMWQINQLAHKGRFGSDAALKNPSTNARAAYALFKESGFQPWSTWPSDASGWTAKARAAVTGGGTSGGSGGGGATSGPAGAFAKSQAAAGKAHGAEVKSQTSLTGPGQASGSFAGALDVLGLGKAEAGTDAKKLLPLLMKELNLKLARLAKVKKALKTRLTAATRSRLTQEATTLVGELADIWEAAVAVGAKGAPPKGVVEKPGDPADAAGGADAADAPSAGDFVDAAIAEAALTPGMEDDIAAAGGAVGFWEGELGAARASGDPRRVTAAASGLKGARDNLTALTDAVKANTEALNGVRADLEKQRADNLQASLNVSQSQYGVLAQAITDVVSGRLGGTLGLGLSGLRAPAGAVARI